MKKKVYIDARGWRYRVMPGLGEHYFKGRYNTPEGSGWHGMRQLPWRDNADAAQVDLDLLAQERGWKAEEQEAWP